MFFPLCGKEPQGNFCWIRWSDITDEHSIYQQFITIIAHQGSDPTVYQDLQPDDLY